MQPVHMGYCCLKYFSETMKNVPFYFSADGWFFFLIRSSNKICNGMLTKTKQIKRVGNFSRQYSSTTRKKKIVAERLLYVYIVSN